MSAHPNVAVARSLARSYGEHGVAVFFLRADGTFGFASYGSHRANCDEMKRWAEKVHDFTTDGIIRPPELSP